MLELQATIDKDSGFCFGVVYAIDMAEQILDEDGYLYCLGDIVHNDEEVARLKESGLRIIDHEALKQLRGEKVLIREHGEAPETYRTALENDIQRSEERRVVKACVSTCRSRRSQYHYTKKQTRNKQSNI